MIGLRESMIGLRESMIGLRESMIGLHESKIRLHESKIRLHESKIRFHESKIRLHESNRGLKGCAATWAGLASPIGHARNRVKKTHSASPPTRSGSEAILQEWRVGASSSHHGGNGGSDATVDT